MPTSLATLPRRLRAAHILHLALFALAPAGCDHGLPDAEEPPAAICLYDSAVCSIGSWGDDCPPAAADYTTHCLDITDGTCVAAGQESEFDADVGQTYYYYTSNPRIVEGVSCDDYSADPGLDPGPLAPTCAFENDGSCDAPGVCPEGTDLDDCEAPACDPLPPDPDACTKLAIGAAYCSNVDGGESCAAGADAYTCQAGGWTLANQSEALQICRDDGYTAYAGCATQSDTILVYCE